MRPIKLIMSAFGSYAGVQEIGFDGNGENLFLITGDTGAGKSTIFDAICFALYGKMSGENREGNMMRSDYALSEQKTYVEFLFEDKGERYKIIRNPEYDRKGRKKKKNKDGSLEYPLVKEKAKVEFYFLRKEMEESGEEKEQAFHGSLREVNAKIVEILGMDQGQFTQIAMIAQGEFMKLLVSPTEQKKEIFQKLFHTEKYRQIVKILANRKKEKEIELAKNKTESETILQETACFPESRYRADFEHWKESYVLHKEEFLEVLELEIKEEQEMAASSHREMEQLKKEREALLLELHTMEETNRLFDELSKAEKTREEWKEKEKEAKEKERLLEKAEKAEKAAEKKRSFDEVFAKKEKKQKEIEKRKREIEKTQKQCECMEKEYCAAKKEREEKEELLAKEILELEKNLPKYEEIETITKEKQAQELQADQWDEWLLQQETMIAAQEKNRLEYQKKKEKTEEILKEFPEKKQQLSRIKEKLEKFGKLYGAAEQIEALFLQKKASMETKEMLEQNFRRQGAVYEELLIQFMNGQAGFMAQKLKEGMPCPVCGNTHHIRLAKLEKEIPTEEEVNKAKQLRELAEKEMISGTKKAKEDQERYDRIYYECRETCRELTEGSIQLSEDGKNLQEISEHIAALKAEEKELVKENKKMERMEKEQKTCDEKIREIEEALTKGKKEAKDAEEKKRKACQEVLRLKTVEELQKKELLYEDREEAGRKLQEKRKLLETIVETCRSLSEKKEASAKLLLSQSTEKLTMEKEFEGLQLECDEKKELYEQTIKEQGFFSEEEWILSSAEEKQKKIWKEEAEHIKKEIIAAEQSFQTLKKQVQGKERKEEHGQKELLLEKTRQLEMVSKKEQEVYFCLKKNKEAQKKLKERKKQSEQLLQEYGQIKSLYEVANGTLAGAVKIDLETFVQRQYLKQVLKAANRRFLSMSKGQFELRLKEGTEFDQKSNQGLDLSVYSLLTNTNRDIKTLSGGESFMAALSMALGMADIVQGAVGGIRLDMMFLDEGFGSLDELSRQQAVKVLKELSDGKRMIGIISHVTELKEQVAKKLIVERDEKGSRAYWDF